MVQALFTKYSDGHSSLKCPFCEHEDEYNLMIGYSEKPMLWCDSCGARSVLMLPQSNYEDETDDYICNHCEMVSQDQEKKVYAIDLCYVTKILTHQLYLYQRRDQTIEVSQADLRKIIEIEYGSESICDNWDCKKDCQVCRRLSKYGLVRHELEDGELDLENVDFGLELECNSFDITNPSVAYPNGLDLSHDGISIFVEFKNENGQLVKSFYSGC